METVGLKRLLSRFALTKTASANSAAAKLAKIRYVGLAIFLGHLSCYVMWKSVFPQQYESLTLRVVCCLPLVPLILDGKLGLRKWFNHYVWFAITLSLPSALFFLYLMNDAYAVGAQFLLISIIVISYFGIRFAATSLAAGIAIGTLCYLATSEPHISQATLQSIFEQIPVICFFAIVLTFVRIERETILDAKQSGIAAAMAHLAHELRTPLASIELTLSGIDKILKSDHQPDALPPLWGRIPNALQRMRQDVRTTNKSIDLFVVNCLEPVTVRQTPFDVGAAIRDAVDAFPFQDGTKPIRLTLIEQVIAVGDEGLFQMVVHNLIKNSLHAIARAGKGEICISLGRNELGCPTVIFIDTAQGIPPYVLPFIFNRFYAYPTGAGNGVGLSFCKHITSLFNAKMSCRSILGHHTIFFIEFPLNSHA